VADLGKEKRAERCLKKDLFGCLHDFDLDKELWKSIRTTNILERAFHEVRRRTRPMNNFFPNEASANRIMHCISDMPNQNWKDKTLKVISTNYWT
jgi:transposase-like protein